MSILGKVNPSIAQQTNLHKVGTDNLEIKNNKVQAENKGGDQFEAFCGTVPNSASQDAVPNMATQSVASLFLQSNTKSQLIQSAAEKVLESFAKQIESGDENLYMKFDKGFAGIGSGGYNKILDLVADGLKSQGFDVTKDDLNHAGDLVGSMESGDIDWMEVGVRVAKQVAQVVSPVISGAADKILESFARQLESGDTSLYMKFDQGFEGIGNVGYNQILDLVADGLKSQGFDVTKDDLNHAGDLTGSMESGNIDWMEVGVRVASQVLQGS